MYVGDKKIFLIQGDCPQSFNWDEYGLRISVPQNTLSSKETVELAIAVLVGGQFQFPNGTEVVSAIYSLSIAKPLIQPIKLEIQHCAQLVTQDHTAYLSFAKASSKQDIHSYNFQLVEGGQFYPGSQYGSIFLAHFCLMTIVKALFCPIIMLFKYDSTSSEETTHISTGEAQSKEGNNFF